MSKFSRVFALFFACCVAVSLVAACSSPSKSAAVKGGGGAGNANDAEPWPAPANPMELARKAGLQPEVAEELKFHVHAHLDVFINGNHILVPAGIGIDTTNPGVHTAPLYGHPAYGGITVPCNTPCISPLHTHDVGGVVHTESSTRKFNTLGEFFIEWNQPLSPTQVGTYTSPQTPIAFYENGKKSTSDPRDIALSDLKEIVIVIGTPPAQIPSSFDLSLI